jgi:tRNA A37 threonylcarbamoyladenosine dehydratase
MQLSTTTDQTVTTIATIATVTATDGMLLASRVLQNELDSW